MSKEVEMPKMEDIVFNLNLQYSEGTMYYKDVIDKAPAKAGEERWFDFLYHKALDEGEECEAALKRINEELGIEPWPQAGFLSCR